MCGFPDTKFSVFSVEAHLHTHSAKEFGNCETIVTLSSKI